MYLNVLHTCSFRRMDSCSGLNLCLSVFCLAFWLVIHPLYTLFLNIKYNSTIFLCLLWRKAQNKIFLYFSSSSILCIHILLSIFPLSLLYFFVFLSNFPTIFILFFRPAVQVVFSFSIFHFYFIFLSSSQIFYLFFPLSLSVLSFHFLFLIDIHTHERREKRCLLTKHKRISKKKKGIIVKIFFMHIYTHKRQETWTNLVSTFSFIYIGYFLLSDPSFISFLFGKKRRHPLFFYFSLY